MKPLGPFNLLNQNRYFNGWPTLSKNKEIVVMTFPVEGWQSSAAVTLFQENDGSLKIAIFGTDDEDNAKQQALASMSLDEDGSGWAKVGKLDKHIGNLQEKYHYIRPSLFHSPFEAAAAFVIGHRISIVQARKIRLAMAAELGQKVDVMDEVFYAFPGPKQLLKLREFKGLNEIKISRLHSLAEAALDGWLDRKYLRELDDKAALTKLETLPGVGPFFSQGILYRGAGKKDGFTHDDMTRHAIETVYDLSKDATEDEIVAISESWRPYRMWTVVLLHIWLRETKKFQQK